MGERGHPPIIGQTRGVQAQFRITAACTVDQPANAELLSEAPQLTQRRRPLLKIHKVRLHPPLGEKPERLPRIGGFLDAKDLNFHNAPAIL